MTAPLVTITDHTPGRTITLDDLEPHMLDAPRIDPPEPARAPRGTPLETPHTGERPGDLFNASNTPEDVLLSAGWTLHHTDPNGERHYTRPGKNARDGSSATVYPDGHACIWTDATELEPRRWYDAFGLLAATQHGGSIVDATAHVRTLGYGAKPNTPPRDTVRATTTPSADGEQADAGSGLESFYIHWPDLWARDTSSEDWLVQPVLGRGRGHAMFAAAGVGKSHFTLEIAAALATGRPILNRPAREPLNVLYLDYEMTADDLRDRLEELGYDADSDLTHLHYALLPSIPPLDTVDGGHIVHQAALACRAELVVIDTTARAVAGEENDANVYRAFYRHTGTPLKQAGIAWMRLDHAGKDPEKGQRGSSAKNDDVDVVWRLERRTGNDLRLVATKRRMTWVPPEVDLAAKETDDGAIHVASEPTYPDRTFHVVELLDKHDIPTSWSKRQVGTWLREQGEKARNDAIAAAIKHRRNRPDLIGDHFGDHPKPPTGDHSGGPLDKTPSQSRGPLPGPSGTASGDPRTDTPSDVVTGVGTGLDAPPAIQDEDEDPFA